MKDFFESFTAGVLGYAALFIYPWAFFERSTRSVLTAIILTCLIFVPLLFAKKNNK